MPKKVNYEYTILEKKNKTFLAETEAFVFDLCFSAIIGLVNWGFVFLCKWFLCSLTFSSKEIPLNSLVWIAVGVVDFHEVYKPNFQRISPHRNVFSDLVKYLSAVRSFAIYLENGIIMGHLTWKHT